MATTGSMTPSPAAALGNDSRSLLARGTRFMPSLRDTIDVSVLRQVVPMPDDDCDDCSRMAHRVHRGSRLSEQKMCDIAAEQLADLLASSSDDSEVLSDADSAPGSPGCPDLGDKDRPCCPSHRVESVVLFVTIIGTGRRLDPLVLLFDDLKRVFPMPETRRNESEAMTRIRYGKLLAAHLTARVSVSRSGDALSLQGDLGQLTPLQPASKAAVGEAPHVGSVMSDFAEASDALNTDLDEARDNLGAAERNLEVRTMCAEAFAAAGRRANRKRSARKTMRLWLSARDKLMFAKAVTETKRRLSQLGMEE